MGDHWLCVHPDSGISSLGASPCCEKPASLVDDGELEILIAFMLDDALETKCESIVYGVGTSWNESLHAKFNIYRDKRVHYTYNNVN